MTDRHGKTAGGIGERVYWRRVEQKLSQAALSDLAEVSRSYLTQLEGGDVNNPSAAVLARIARCLHTSVEQLLDDSLDNNEVRVESLDPALRKLAREENLSLVDIEVLSKIKWRGKSPSTLGDWRFLYQALERTVSNVPVSENQKSNDREKTSEVQEVSAALMRRIAQAIECASRSGGPIDEHFRSNYGWQAPMRQSFAAFNRALDSARSCIECEKLMLYLNGRHNTHFPVAQMPQLCEDFISSVLEIGWHIDDPPRLLTCSESEVHILSNFYIEMLRRSRSRRAVVPWSFLSKWLSSVYPNSFVVYDKRVAASLHSWSCRAFSELPVKAIERLQYDVDNRFWVRNWDDPRWYEGIMKFYRICWTAASEAGLDHSLLESAERIQGLLRGGTKAQNASFTVLNIVDSHLCLANGDPSKLGIE